MIFDILAKMIGNTELNSKHIFFEARDDIYCSSKNKSEKFPLFKKIHRVQSSRLIPSFPDEWPLWNNRLS